MLAVALSLALALVLLVSAGMMLASGPACREALVRLDVNPPPPEPRLQAVAAELLARGITGARLAELEGGWAPLFDEAPNEQRVAAGGARLFAMAAELLGESDDLIDAAGRLFALASVRRRGLASM